MSSSNMHAETADSIALPVKELTFVLLLLVPIILGEYNVALDVVNFSSSEVELSCKLEHEGNLTNVLYDVMKGSATCVHRNKENCQTSNNCDITCGRFINLKQLTLFVPLDRRCKGEEHVRCTVNAETEEGSKVELERSIELPAHSDPPKISINKGKPMNASCDRREIVCTVTNMCKETELHISGDITMAQPKTSYKREGERFTTTTKTTAIFDAARNYTINCTEAGKGLQYSRFETLIVYPSYQVKCCKVSEKGEEPKVEEAAIPWMATCIATVFLICLMCLYLIYQRTQKNKRKYSSLLLENGVDGTRPVPKMLQPVNKVCGIFIDKDKQKGNAIAESIRKQRIGNYVDEANITHITHIQKAHNYRRYFALISSDSLENKEFVAYLRSVLLRKYSMVPLPTVVLVIDYENFDIEDEQLDSRLVVNWREFPIVNTKDEAFEENTAKKLVCVPHIESRQDFENMGTSLAWYYFLEYLALILPEMRKRFENSQHFKELMIKPMRYIIIIPETCREPATHKHLSNIDGNFQPSKSLDDESKGSDIVVQHFKSETDDVHFFGEYARHVVQLEEMVREGELGEEEMMMQLHQFTETLKTIVQSHPVCIGNAEIVTFKENSKLAESLVILRKEEEEAEKRNADTRECSTSEVQNEPDTKYCLTSEVQKLLGTEGLVQFYVYDRLKAVSSDMVERIKGTSFYHEKKMPWKIFILLPYSDYNVLDRFIELNVISGKGQSAITKICKISDCLKTYFAFVDCCTPVKLIHEMKKTETNPDGLPPVQIAAEIRVFYEILYNLTNGPNAPDYCCNFEVVYFSGDENLSRILLKKIKESLAEEFCDNFERDRPSNCCSV